MFHSKFYKRTTKCINYGIVYQTPEQDKNYGLIAYFCAFKPESLGASDHETGTPEQVVAVVEKLLPHPTITLSSDAITHASVSHIVPCTTSTDRYLVVVPVTNIKNKIVYINFNENDCV